MVSEGRGQLTIQLLEDTLDSAGAACAGHGDVEFVVVCHCNCLESGK